MNVLLLSNIELFEFINFLKKKENLMWNKVSDKFKFIVINKCACESKTL